MEIYPAIDLRNNRCVRLVQGQFDRVIEYNDDPIATAENYAEQGANWLHIVDLDAALQKGEDNLTMITELAKISKLKLQVGGGIRDSSQIHHLLSLGVKRVIIGSVAVKEPSKARTWLKEFGNEHIVAAIDVFTEDNPEPIAAIFGWQEYGKITLWKLLNDYADSELKHVLCTDISRDGTLTGPCFELYQKCTQNYPQYAFQASGGVSQLGDLQQLKQDKLSGVIIGKALYENRFSLRDAISTITPLEPSLC